MAREVLHLVLPAMMVLFCTYMAYDIFREDLARARRAYTEWRK